MMKGWKCERWKDGIQRAAKLCQVTKLRRSHKSPWRSPETPRNRRELRLVQQSAVEPREGPSLRSWNSPRLCSEIDRPSKAVCNPSEGESDERRKTLKECWRELKNSFKLNLLNLWTVNTFEKSAIGRDLPHVISFSRASEATQSGKRQTSQGNCGQSWSARKKTNHSLEKLRTNF